MIICLDPKKDGLYLVDDGLMVWYHSNCGKFIFSPVPTKRRRGWLPSRMVPRRRQGGCCGGAGSWPPSSISFRLPAPSSGPPHRAHAAEVALLRAMFGLWMYHLCLHFLCYQCLVQSRLSQMILLCISEDTL